MRTLLFPLGLVLALATGASAQSAGKLSASVAGVRNDSGSVRCGLYSSADGFREPGREMRGAVAPIKNGQATCVFSGVSAGTYAIAVFHAEHNETQNKTWSAAQGVELANPRSGRHRVETVIRSSGKPATIERRGGLTRGSDGADLRS
jgi:Uncharacterized protein conserved in bacteria (DUF2141)